MMSWMLAAALLAPVEGACVTCHPEERVLLERSVHSREGVGCESCHGGDPKALEVEPAHSGNYVGIPERREIPRSCASCHSDPVRMRPYNLPSDQFALYQISAHGRLLAEGEERVAVCTDCHKTHDIRQVNDGESPAFPTRVPETCGQCHGDEVLMGEFGRSATSVEEFRGSVHGKALLDDGDPSAPSCARCHGVHGATPPGFGDVDKVCGQCHATARDFFVGSVHEEAMDAVGLPECAGCHGNHAIDPAGSELASEVCAECHENGSGPAELGRKLMTLQAAASQEITSAEGLISQAEQVPLDVEDYWARLELAKTHLQEVYPTMHSVDLDKVTPLAVAARSEAEEIQREIYEKLSDIRIRRLGLVVFWFYILLTVAILVALRRQKSGV